MSNNECIICYETNLNFTLSCNHKFHRSCLLEWSSAKYMHGEINCPSCREPIEMKSLVPDKERVTAIKELALLKLKDLVGILNKLRNDKKNFNICNKQYMEEIKVFAPLVYKYITKPKEFYDIVELFTDVKIKNTRFEAEKQVQPSKKRTLPPSWLERGEVDIGDGVPRRILSRR